MRKVHKGHLKRDLYAVLTKFDLYISASSVNGQLYARKFEPVRFEIYNGTPYWYLRDTGQTIPAEFCEDTETEMTWGEYVSLCRNFIEQRTPNE